MSQKAMFQESALVPVQPAAIEVVTPMALLQMAVSQNADLDKLAKLMDLQERWEANEARKAFDAAMSECKATLPRVVKSVAINDGPLKGKMYADLASVTQSLNPHLSKYDLSASWKLTKDEPTWIEVTCTIRHKLGHSEPVSMGGPPDTGGAKNAIQARASTVNYLERYTLLAAVGAAAAGADTDGIAPADIPQMPEPLYNEWMDAIQQAPNPEALNGVWRQAMAAAEKHGDKSAKLQFIKAKDKAKGAL